MSITATKDAKAASGTSTDELNLGPYYIQYLPGDHYVLDVNGNNKAEGTQVIGYTVNLPQTGNQQWQFVPAGPEEPGWWYLQTMMGSKLVMTLQPDTTLQPTPVVMLPIDAKYADRQLWSLLSTEEAGYWYIQCKFEASNSQSPMVIGLVEDSPRAQAVASPISFTGFRAQAWGFRPVGNAG